MTKTELRGEKVQQNAGCLLLFFFWNRLTLGMFVTAFNVFLNGSMARWLNMFDVLMCLSLQHSTSIDFNIIYISPVLFCVSANI